MWDMHRIQRDHGLKEKYGLKNLRELWLLDSELRRIRKNVRLVLSNRLSDEVGKQTIGRLSRYSIVGSTATLDELLTLNVDSFLERRLQTLVFRKGLATSIKQARQLVVHGYIAISGKKASSPSRLILGSEEIGIGYYKPIKIEIKPAVTMPAAATTAETPAVQ